MFPSVTDDVIRPISSYAKTQILLSDCWSDGTADGNVKAVLSQDLLDRSRPIFLNRALLEFDPSLVSAPAAG